MIVSISSSSFSIGKGTSAIVQCRSLSFPTRTDGSLLSLSEAPPIQYSLSLLSLSQYLLIVPSDHRKSQLLSLRPF